MSRNDKAIVLGASVISIALLLIAIAVAFPPKLVWNASESAPMGLYLIRNRQPVLGEFALVTPSKPVANFIAARGYLPGDTPLLKRVAALPGDEICRENMAVFVNGLHVADAQETDSLGRDMPQWSGCFTLNCSETFLLNGHPKSLDGRYFGATHVNDVIGVAAPVIVKKQAG